MSDTDDEMLLFFAGLALQGLLANNNFEGLSDKLWKEIGMTPPDALNPAEDEPQWTPAHYAKLIAARAYRIADAMMAERACRTKSL